jgi:signal recognition particle subunit SRP54
VTGCPILFVGTGEKIDDLDAFHPERMAGRILGMGDVVGLVEKAQQEISETEAQSSFEKMVLGDFTLEDMLAQIRMIRRLGPMKKVLGMMPGLGKLTENVDIDDRQLNRLEAIFTSMTVRERLQPDLLDMSRRRRIARGSGQEVGAVNELLKRHRDMKLMMRQLGKLGLGSRMGGKAKREALKDLSPTGELASTGAGLFGGLGGGLTDLFGGGGAGDLPAGFDPMSRRPMGTSSTRQSGSKARKAKDKRKKRKKKR